MPSTQIDLRHLLPDPEVVARVPAALAARFCAVPLSVDGTSIRIAMRDTSDLEALDYLEMVTQLRPIPVAAPEKQIRELLARAYGTSGSVSDEFESMVAEAARAAREHTDGTELPIVRLVDQILSEAVRVGATDIHVQPEEDELLVRFRLDGMLRIISRLPAPLHLPVATRLKVMANLDISERRLPQDGQIDMEMGSHRIDVRVSTAPTLHGENVVLRILDHSKMAWTFEDLGFEEIDRDRILKLVQRPNGIFLVTGPTGSGKTTSLYASLRTLDSESLNIMTLEDPVEYRLEKIRQSQISEKAGYTFATGLRSFMRQDPDVILVGEIRDLETAEIAIRAALTGHLVLSTLHTNSALASLYRLRDMGVPSYLLAPTLAGVLAQRLVRRNCSQCSEPHEATHAERQFLGLAAGTSETPVTLYRGKGCPECQRTGFAGRFAIYELLEVDESLREALGAEASESDLIELARRRGFVSIGERARQRVLAGWTTVEEAARATT